MLLRLVSCQAMMQTTDIMNGLEIVFSVLLSTSNLLSSSCRGDSCRKILLTKSLRIS